MKLVAFFVFSPYVISITIIAGKVMNKISRFVIWICARFDRAQIEQIIQQLQDILANRNPDVKPRDDFKKNIRNTRTSM